MTDVDLPGALEQAELERLFQRGDYRSLRDRAAKLRAGALERGDEEAVQNIERLLERLRPDPTGAWIYLLAFVLLATITALTYAGAIG